MEDGKDLELPSGRVRASDKQSTGAAHTPVWTVSALGLPWHLRDHEDGYEINCTPVGWLTRIVLDDTIGNHPRDDDPDFRRAQREHADFIIHAVNCHHDLVEALKIVRSSGANSARIGDKHDDVVIARSAWNDVLAAISKAGA